MKKLFSLLTAIVLFSLSAMADNYLAGTWTATAWSTGDDVKFSNDELTLTLDANTEYQFKIYDNAYGEKWYGNGGIMTFTNCSDWTFYESANNAKIKTTAAGDYKFRLVWNGSIPSLSVEYPEFYILGEWNEWTVSDAAKFDANHMLALHLTPGQYGFKVKAGSQWFTNLGTMNVGNIGWNFDNTDGGAANCTLNITVEGDYVFTYGWNVNFPMLGFYNASGNIMSASTTPIKADEGADGNLGTRWASIQNDYEWWMIKYATAKTFNTVKIVWEGAWTQIFDLLGSNDGTNWTLIKTVDQTLDGFPNTQIYDLGEDVTYQYVKFFAKLRGTGYGNSFWEFDTYHAETQVLTDLSFSAAATICSVGGNVVLTATPKDQYDTPMPGEAVNYVVTPAAAGHVNAGVYYADAEGAATITATCANDVNIHKQVSIYNYAGSNVAQGKSVIDVVGGYNDAARLVDGIDGSNEWQGDPNNGGTEHNVTCGFTIDLAALYDLSLVTIKFEGACSDEYTIETSADNTAWETAYNFSGTLGINGRTDYYYPGGAKNLANNTNVRYVKFTSTKNATDWGMKIFEVRVFGVEAAPVDPVASVSLDQTAVTLEVGQSVTLTKTVLPGTSDQHVTWTVAPAGVVTVDNGLVRAVAEGTATVTVTSNADGSKSASCVVTVDPFTAKKSFAIVEDANTHAYYSITTNDDHTLTFDVHVYGTGVSVFQVNDKSKNDQSAWHTLENNAGVRSWTSEDVYEQNAVFEYFLYFPARFDRSYVVGSEANNTYERPVTAGKYGTLCLPFTANVKGVQLYTIAGKTANDIVLAEVDDNVAEAGKAYVYYAEKAGTLTATYTAVAAHGTNDGLVGALKDTQVTLNGTTKQNIYFLSNNKLMHWIGNDEVTVAANKAYFDLTDVSAPSAVAARRIPFEEQVATDLDAIDADSNVVKLIENGQLFIIKNGVRYNALGQVVR